MPAFEYVFPSIRGIQAGREYYVSMCPLRLIPRIFLFDEEELKPELRSQRTMNKQRIPEMSRYILKNTKNYVFSSLTASIDGTVRFEPIDSQNSDHSMGQLHIPMKGTRFVINDGQHRRAAIEQALFDNPELGDETISVVFFIDVGLKRSQQMFADLNRYAIRPSPSLGILYDHRDDLAIIAKSVVQKVPLFNELCERERSNISNRSIKLFTLSGIHSATDILIADLGLETIDEKIEVATGFWCEVSLHLKDWQLVRERKVSSAELRQDYIHAHSLALSALARAGNSLLKNHKRGWKSKIKKLSTLDWSRSNLKLWDGRAMNNGRLSKSNTNIVLTGNVIKKHLGLSLESSEEEKEREFRKNKNVKK